MKTQEELYQKTQELKSLTDADDALINRLNAMRPGLFHSGVNALKNQADVLKNIKQNQR